MVGSKHDVRVSFIPNSFFEIEKSSFTVKFFEQVIVKELVRFLFVAVNLEFELCTYEPPCIRSIHHGRFCINIPFDGYLVFHDPFSIFDIFLF